MRGTLNFAQFHKVMLCITGLLIASLLSLAISDCAYASIEYRNPATAKGTVAVSYESGDSSVSFHWDSGKNGSPKNVKLSNKKVARLTMFKDVGALYVDAKKPGKTVLTYTYKGKKHKVTIRVYKYSNPVKSFVVGGKQYKARYNKRSDVDLGPSTHSLPAGKVNIKAAKNWKLKTIEIVWPASYKTIKNGGKMPAGADFMRVTFYNKKTKVHQDVIMCCGLC